MAECFMLFHSHVSLIFCATRSATNRTIGSNASFEYIAVAQPLLNEIVLMIYIASDNFTKRLFFDRNNKLGKADSEWGFFTTRMQISTQHEKVSRFVNFISILNKV